MKDTLIVNFFAGPGAGKSTLAAGLFYRLKMKGYDVELVREFAKDATWEDNKTALANQLFISATQHHRQEILMGKVDVIVTDSPILIGLFYKNIIDLNVSVAMDKLVLAMFKGQRNLNFFVDRKKAYNPNGRNQTEAEALAVDVKTKLFLNAHEVGFNHIEGTERGLDEAFRITELDLTLF